MGNKIMTFLYTGCMSTTSDRPRGWRLLTGTINIQKQQHYFWELWGKHEAGKWPCCSTDPRHTGGQVRQWGSGGGLTGRSSSCCPDKRRPSLETLPKVLALHFVAVSHAGNIPKALAVVGCRLCVSGLLFVAVVAR